MLVKIANNLSIDPKDVRSIESLGWMGCRIYYRDGSYSNCSSDADTVLEIINKALGIA